MADANDVATEHIAPQGDIMLIVGKKPEARLRVSSAVLIANSPVFAAMLGPNFQEGLIAGTTETPKEVALPDDEATAMSDMCNLLHLKTPSALCAKPASRILPLAIANDKYGCHDALILQSDALLSGWLRRNPQGTSNLSHMAAAAYLLNHKSMFKILTSRLILETDTSFSSVLKEGHGHIIPVAALLALEEKRTAAQCYICVQLPIMGTRPCNQHLTCQNDYDHALMDGLALVFGTRRWPPNFSGSLKVCDAVTKIRRMGGMSREFPTCAHTKRTTMITGGDSMDFAASVEKMCAGLCLRCVKEGLPDLTTKCSLAGHP
ncbi:hypothetical protein LTR08_005481 [Meristemomyces frigidus]|nr:hypothetical protein LTR08_005481 [Meristemomyces frigidus]